MTTSSIYLGTALLVIATSLVSLLLTHHLLRKVLALNVMASAVFLLLVVLAYRPPAETVGAGTRTPPGGPAGTIRPDSEETTAGGPGPGADPLPHALVLTGIVVSFGASALAVSLARRIHADSGEARLPEEQP